MIVRVARKFTISCAHHLPGHPKCHRPHGHNYTIELVVEGPLVNGMVIDFGDLKALFKKHIEDRYDHTDLNDFPELEMPTAEKLAAVIGDLLYDEIQWVVPSVATHLCCVRVWETPDAYAEVLFP